MSARASRHGDDVGMMERRRTLPSTGVRPAPARREKVVNTNRRNNGDGRGEEGRLAGARAAAAAGKIGNSRGPPTLAFPPIRTDPQAMNDNQYHVTSRSAPKNGSSREQIVSRSSLAFQPSLRSPAVLRARLRSHAAESFKWKRTFVMVDISFSFCVDRAASCSLHSSRWA